MNFHQLRTLFLTCGLCIFLVACKSTEERASDYFASAQDLIAAGDTDRAIIELRNVFDLVPTHAEARRSMARLMEGRGNLLGAFRQYEQLAELLPDDPEARIALAELSFEARKWEDFERHGQRAVELSPDTPRTDVIAIALAYRTAVLEEDDPAIDAIQAQAETAAAGFEDGNSLLEQVLYDSYLRAGDLDAALEQLEQKILRRPDLRILYDQRLTLLRQIGDDAAIEAHLRRVVDTFPEDDEAKRLLLRYFMTARALDKAESFLRQISDPTDENPDYFITLIQFLKDVHGTDVARAELEAGIAVSPIPDQLRITLAALDYGDGQREAAIGDLQKAIDRRVAEEAALPLTNQMRIALSHMLRANRNMVGAERLVDEVLSTDAGNVEGLKLRAARRINVDEVEAAIADLRRALDTAPEDVNALNLMADAYLRAGSRDLALDFVAQAVASSGQAAEPSLRYARLLRIEENDRAAEEVLISALRRSPGNEEILLMLGDIYLQEQDLARAEMVSQQLQRIGTEAALAAANRMELALLVQREGTAQVLTFLEQMAASEDAGMGERVTLLRAQLALGQTEDALQLAEELVAEAPDDPDRLFLRALARAATGDLSTARSDMRTLVTEEPNREAVWEQLYRMTHIESGPDAASLVLTEALNAMPDSPKLLWARAGELEKSGDIDAAIAIYEDLYARNTGDVIFANNLASLLVTYRDDVDSLERAWTVARRLRDTEVPAFQDTYGWLAFRRGEPDIALPYLEAAAAGLPQDPLVHYHLAQTYTALDLLPQAITAYARVLELTGADDPRPQIATARTELARLQNAEPVTDKP